MIVCLQNRRAGLAAKVCSPPEEVSILLCCKYENEMWLPSVNSSPGMQGVPVSLPDYTVLA